MNSTLKIVMLLWLAALLSGCAGLQSPREENQEIFVLDASAAPNAPRVRLDLVLLVGAPAARAGYDTPQIAYTRRSHQLDYFARSRWAETPARMLAPLLAQALERSGSFRAVLRAPGAVPADLRLDTELIRLEQDFDASPSRARLTLRAQLIDVRAGKVLAGRDFDESESAPSEDAYGGVIAANRALARLLQQLAAFCVESAERR